MQTKGVSDFVTTIDMQNEDMIFKALKRRFPSYKFIGEVIMCHYYGVNVYS